jgi:hypothetical protein
MNNSSEDDDVMDFDQSRQNQENDLENILRDLEGSQPYRAFTIQETIKI